jgi:hypothetical protein
MQRSPRNRSKNRSLPRPAPPSRRPLASTPGGGRANCGREPVAAAELGADEVAVFTKSLAQREDLSLQVLLRDNDAGPHTAHKLVLADQRSVGLQQHQEEIERARSQFYRHAVGDQLPLAQQHAEPAKFECRFGWRPPRPVLGNPRIVARPRRNRFHELSPLEGIEQRAKATRAFGPHYCTCG